MLQLTQVCRENHSDPCVDDGGAHPQDNQYDLHGEQPHVHSLVHGYEMHHGLSSYGPKYMPLDCYYLLRFCIRHNVLRGYGANVHRVSNQHGYRVGLLYDRNLVRGCDCGFRGCDGS